MLDSEIVSQKMVSSLPGRFLATAYIFGCHGVVTEWAAYTVHNGSHPVEFHVWQADEALPNVYHLVGMNVFQDAQPDASHLISFQVPPEEQIVHGVPRAHCRHADHRSARGI